MLKIYTVFDSKPHAYLPPFFMKSNGEAVRAFSDTVNNPESSFNKHPEDYTLFELGNYDESTGKIETFDAMVALGNAVEFLADNNSL